MSTLKTSNIQDTSGNNNSTPEQINQGRAKAWARFTVSSGTPSITDNFNVSSLTDNATGDISVNFTSSMANANYATVCMSDISSSNVQIPFTEPSGKSTSAVQLQFFRVASFTGGGNKVDPAGADVVVFGD